jgi:hypothetical protein
MSLDPARKLAARIAAWWALVVGGSWFMRGWVTGQLWDFAIIYTSSRAWLEGHDPYDQDYLNHWWNTHASSSALTQDVSWLPTVVPPPTQAAMSPFACFEVGTARWVWLAVVLVLVCLQLAALSSLAGTRGTRRLLLFAYVVSMGPMQIGITSGQPAIPAIALIIVAVWLATRGRDAAAAVLLGIASALKAQLGLPYVALYLYLRRWKAGGGGAAVFALISAIAWARLELAHLPEWQHHWHEKLALVLADGGANDYSSANASRHQLMNLQLLVNVFVHNRPLTVALSWFVLSIPGATFLHLTWRDAWGKAAPDGQREFFFAAFLAPFTLLPVYHRYYDGTLMSLTMAWAIGHWDAADAWVRRAARWAAVVLLALLMPVQASPASLINRGILPIPRWLETGWLWNATVTAQYVWVLLIVLVVMLIAIAAHIRGSSADRERAVLGAPT